MAQRAPLRSHDDLEAYQLSMKLLVAVHGLSRKLLADERYQLGSQMRRASKSVPANISEGFSKRASVREFKHYMRTAMGSSNEMETHLRIAQQLRYAGDAQLDELIDGYNHIGRALNRLISTWQRFEETSNVEPRTSSKGG